MTMTKTAAAALADLRGLDEALLAELPADLATATRAVLAAIHADMAGPDEPGFTPIPADVGSFSRLHDYRDANMWVIDALTPLLSTPEHYGDEYADGSKLSAADQAAVDAETAMANAVTDQVDRILRVEAEALSVLAIVIRKGTS